MKPDAKCIILVLSLLLPAGLMAQRSDVLEAYVRTGLEQNLSLQQKTLDWQKSLEAIRQAKGLFYPALEFQANYTRAAGGRSIGFPVGDLLNDTYSTLNQLTQTNRFPQLENQKINFLPDNFHETYLGFSLPLFNTDLRYNRDIRIHQAESAGALKKAYEQELRFRIEEAYWQYLQAREAEHIWENTRTVLAELRRFNESLVRNGVATRDVIAIADYEISKTDREIAALRAGQRTARAYFNFLLNRDLNAEIELDTSMLNTPPTVAYPAVSTTDALRNRAETEALKAGEATARAALNLQEAGRKYPEFYVGGQLGFQGFGYHLADDQAYALARIGLRYDLYTGGQQKSREQSAKLDLEGVLQQQQEVGQQIALQVLQAEAESAASQEAWRSAQLGQQAAEESFRIIRNKYEANQVLLIEYLEAENRVTTARLTLLITRIDLAIKAAALRRAAGN